MPHAENQSELTSTINHYLPNGDRRGNVPSSHFLNHVASYPVINQTLSTYNSTPLGQYTQSMTSSLFSSPLVSSLFASTPASVLAPYARAADNLAESALSRLDSVVPIVREEPKVLRDKAFDTAFLPGRMAIRGKDYILGTYWDEYDKVGGTKSQTAKVNAGGGREIDLVRAGKAFVSAELKIVVDVVRYFGDWFSQGKQTVKDKTS